MNNFLRLSCLSSLALLCACTGGGGDNSDTISADDADPVTVTLPIAYVKRPLPSTPPNFKAPTAFNPGAELIVRNPSGFNGEEINLNSKIRAIVAAELSVSSASLRLDIKDLETSYNGKTLLFAARVVPSPVATNLEFTTWNLWQYDFVSQQVSYVMASPLLRNEGVEYGSAQDTAPHFLTDDRIVFSSTRQHIEQSNQLDEGRGQIYSTFRQGLIAGEEEPSSVLHIFDPDDLADPITQISFNRSHDLDPVVRSSGEIVYSKWISTPGNDQISLFRVNPSGRHTSLLYGYHSGDSGSVGTQVEYTQARELADGRLAAIIKTAASPTLGGNLVVIDEENFVDNNIGVWPQLSRVGKGQSTLTGLTVRTDSQRSSGGQFTAFYPLDDDEQRLLVSWSPCRIMVNGIATPCNVVPETSGEVLAPPLYGVWLYNPNSDTQQPVVLGEEGYYIAEIVAGVERAFPGIAAELGEVDSNLATDNQALLVIDSIYDLDGLDISPAGIAQHATPGSADFLARPVRYMRITKPIQDTYEDILDPPNYAFGVNTNQPMREILGYATVEPDGSVAVAIPAHTNFTFNFLDQNGHKTSTSRHNYWLYAAPGEVIHCSGCHDAGSTVPHGRTDSRVDSSNSGASNLGSRLGYPVTSPSLYASAEGQTMAQIYLQHNPPRQLTLNPNYIDIWSDTALVAAEASIDYSYPADWTDEDSLPAGTDNIAAGKSMVRKNLDEDKPSRIVINYEDHIQPIWERERTDALSDTVTCTGCHKEASSVIPPGQLDLTGVPSDLNPTEHMRSYHELLRGDIKNALDGPGGNVVNRTRTCVVDVLDADGNVIGTANQTVNITIGGNLSSAGARNSSRFWGCFNAGVCGRNNIAEPVLPANCTEDQDPSLSTPTSGTYDHTGLLSNAELRLLSEWLDIGAQYYNNPFDPRIVP
ncbi:hypothetical protein [Dasania marina]|uniref:HzsA-related protein n=1 Tax=Dasania marina TaxID=471499 RepID=UPI0030D967BA|tara:strand:+ start:22269 stop:25052 length:2784 start_codon:yes stop_codon:yes gene_type:complete